MFVAEAGETLTVLADTVLLAEKLENTNPNTKSKTRKHDKDTVLARKVYKQNICAPLIAVNRQALIRVS